MVEKFAGDGTGNDIARRWPEHSGFASEAISRAMQEISAKTGFKADGEDIEAARTIYDKNHVWRVRIRGVWEGRPVSLRMENLKLPRDEEMFRAAFREQAGASNARPPHTYRSSPYDEARGYAWSIDELVEAPELFSPAGDPSRAAEAFATFYLQLRLAVREPFFAAPPGDAAEFTSKQLDEWKELACRQSPARITPLESLLDQLTERMLDGLSGRPLVFMHRHLAGTDVRVMPHGEYVVFANHMWSWRQPGYDVTFPIWGQWLALPPERRTAQEVERVTETWMTMIRRELSDLVRPEDVARMLLNRLFGALLLDVPAIAVRESIEAAAPLEQALVVEAERLLV